MKNNTCLLYTSGHADFEVVAVFGKDRVYQFRKYIVAGYRSKHTVFDIVDVYKRQVYGVW